MEIDQSFNYHGLEKDEALDKLDSNANEGLSQEEARKRLKKYGRNKLPEKGTTSIFKLIIRQFRDFLVLILFIAAIISYLVPARKRPFFEILRDIHRSNFCC